MNESPSTAMGPVTLANWRTAPHNRQAFRNVRSVVPTAAIRRGERCEPFVRSPRALGTLKFADREGVSRTVDETLAAHCTDAFAVWHRGALVDERYWNGMQPDEQHILMSVSKSVTSMLAGAVADRGLLDVGARVAQYVPEVAGGAYDEATVQHLLDMQAGVDFDEDYDIDHGLMIRYREATGWNPPSDPCDPGDLRSFLTSLKARGQHGAPFRYTSPNTDLLGWVLERATGMALPEVFSRWLWRPLGAEFDAYIAVDRLGAPRPAGGICVCLRDLIRVGLLMLAGGLAMQNQVLSPDWVRTSTSTGDTAAWRDGSFGFLLDGGCYRNQWYQYRDELEAFCGLGIHGQYLYVAPRAGTVIARFASQPEPLIPEPTALMLDMFPAIARTLEGS